MHAPMYPPGEKIIHCCHSNKGRWSPHQVVIIETKTHKFWESAVPVLTLCMLKPMLLWPEQSQTSPKRTSWMLTVPSLDLAVTVWGPDDVMGGSFTWKTEERIVLVLVHFRSLAKLTQIKLHMPAVNRRKPRFQDHRNSQRGEASSLHQQRHLLIGKQGETHNITEMLEEAVSFQYLQDTVPVARCLLLNLTSVVIDLSRPSPGALSPRVPGKEPCVPPGKTARDGATRARQWGRVPTTSGKFPLSPHWHGTCLLRLLTRHGLSVRIRLSWTTPSWNRNDEKYGSKRIELEAYYVQYEMYHFNRSISAQWISMKCIVA